MRKIYNLDHGKKYILLPNKIWLGSGKPLENIGIYIEKGIIKSFLKKPQRDLLEKNTDIVFLKLTSKTIIPPLTDSHIHLGLTADRKDLFTKISEVESTLLKYLNEGILGVRDGGDKFNLSLKISKNKLPLINKSGQAIRKEGKYGSFLGVGASRIEKNILDIKTLSQEVDTIKIIITGLISFNSYGQVGEKQFSEFELEALVTEAHKNNCQVMAHVNSAEGIKMALNAKVNSIEHGYYMTKELLLEMVEKKVSWVPTLLPVYNALSQAKTKEQESIIDRIIKGQMASVYLANELGVSLAAGTDSGAVGVDHGTSLFRELLLYKKSGLSNLDVMQTSCINGGKIIDPLALGEIKIGKKMKGLLVLKGNPLENLNYLTEPSQVILLN